MSLGLQLRRSRDGLLPILVVSRAWDGDSDVPFLREGRELKNVKMA